MRVVVGITLLRGRVAGLLVDILVGVVECELVEVFETFPFVEGTDFEVGCPLEGVV